MPGFKHSVALNVSVCMSLKYNLDAFAKDNSNLRQKGKTSSSKNDTR